MSALGPPPAPQPLGTALLPVTPCPPVPVCTAFCSPAPLNIWLCAQTPLHGCYTLKIKSGSKCTGACSVQIHQAAALACTLAAAAAALSRPRCPTQLSQHAAERPVRQAQHEAAAAASARHCWVQLGAGALGGDRKWQPHLGGCAPRHRQPHRLSTHRSADVGWVPTGCCCCRWRQLHTDAHLAGRPAAVLHLWLQLRACCWRL